MRNYTRDVSEVRQAIRRGWRLTAIALLFLLELIHAGVLQLLVAPEGADLAQLDFVSAALDGKRLLHNAVDQPQPRLLGRGWFSLSGCIAS